MAQLIVRQDVTLPEDYVRYFDGHGPTEGGLSVEPLWFQLWPPTELEQLNCGYQVQEFVSGFYGFGSNGGGELLAFVSRGRVFMIPFIPMEEKEAKLVAGSWAEFVERMEK